MSEHRAGPAPSSNPPLTSGPQGTSGGGGSWAEASRRMLAAQLLLAAGDNPADLPFMEQRAYVRMLVEGRLSDRTRRRLLGDLDEIAARFA